MQSSPTNQLPIDADYQLQPIIPSTTKSKKTTTNKSNASKEQATKAGTKRGIGANKTNNRLQKSQKNKKTTEEEEGKF